MLLVSAFPRSLPVLLRSVFNGRCKSLGNFSVENLKNNYSTRASLLELNTNVAKDVILYKSDNARFYKYLNLFALSQFGFWLYLGEWAYSSMRDAPVDESAITEDTPWYRKINLGENKYKNSLAGFCVLTGYIMLAGSWLLTLRSVRYLILRKGGQSVSIVSYTPFGKNRILTIPLKYVCFMVKYLLIFFVPTSQVSAAESRHTARVNLPLKVHRKWLYYMVDMRGEFSNTQLFDATVGLRRTSVV
ncbi:unnamed protein product [Nesidiocoris tenuis]|uniref:Transmembrane protein 223 n=1 Tax=Nesidiocoris tenuis TaxID=355587 RepID=A0A6H5HJY5_9HEMI|nr:unnamed protein product [Nesidiocoris tenuis]